MSFATVLHETALAIGVNLASSNGIGVSVGVNTKGSWTEVVPALPCDVASLLLNVECSSSLDAAFCDIGVGSPDSEVVVVPDLLVSGAAGFDQGFRQWVPIALNFGSRLCIRGQAESAGTVNILITLKCAGVRAPIAFRRAATLNFDAATSGYVNNTIVAQNAYGPWVEMTPAVPFDVKAVSLVMRNEGLFGGGTGYRYLTQVGAGPAGSESVIADAIMMRLRTGAGVCSPVLATDGYPVRIAAGTRVAIRSATTSGDSNATRHGSILTIYG